MKFRVRVRNTRGAEWWEDYDINTTDPEAWAIKTVAEYNATLRKGELERAFLGVEITDADARKHDWFKETGGMSVQLPGRAGTVDLMRCSKCGITGKRFGISAGIIVDSKFRRKAYRECHTTIAYQKELRDKEDV